MPKRKLKVFLSHAPADEAVARQLYEQLNDQGWIDVWLAEENVLPGHDYNLAIEQAINASELAIVCISKSSTSQQGSVQKELRLVLEMAQNMPEGVIYIVPLKLEECEPPFLLRSLRFGNYFDGERERGYQRLLASLRARAEGLGISITNPVSAGSKTPIKTDTTASAQSEHPDPKLEILRDVSNSAVVLGDHNQITINNLSSERGNPENSEFSQKAIKGTTESEFVNINISCYPTNNDDKKVGIEIYNPSSETIENVAINLTRIERIKEKGSPEYLNIPPYNRKLPLWSSYDEFGKIFPGKSVYIHLAEIRDESFFLLLEENYEIKEYDIFYPTVRDGFPPDEVAIGNFEILLQVKATIKGLYGKATLIEKSFTGSLRFTRNKMNWIVDDKGEWKRNQNPITMKIILDEIPQDFIWNTN